MTSTHPAIAARVPLWEEVRDIHEANYLPRVRLPGLNRTPTTAAEAIGERPARYLPIRDQGENLIAYQFAARLIEPDGLLAYTVGSLAGQVAAAEAEISRTWVPTGDDGTPDASGIFGSADDDGSEAARLWADADGAGTNWAVLWRSVITDLILYQDGWIVVDGVRAETVVRAGPTGELAEVTVDRQPSVRWMPPWSCLTYDETGGMLTRAVFQTRRHDRGPDGGTLEVVVETEYRLDGWTRRVSSTQGVGEGEVEAEGTYAYFDDAERRVPRLPVYRAHLPFRTYHAHTWARKALSILNMRMRYDGMLNLGNSPRLVRTRGEHEHDAPDANTPPGSTGSRTADEIIAGGRYHEVGHGGDLRYVEPAMTAAAATAEAIGDKRRAFREEAFQAMSQEAREMTAAEVRQRSASGTDAVLTVLSGAVEEAENQALFLLAQTYRPDLPARWREAYVERSTDFLAFDAAERADTMAERVFGDAAVPVGTKARIEAALRWCEAHGLPYERDEIAADVEAWGTSRGVLPDSARADLRRDLAPEPEPEPEPLVL